MSRGFVIAVPEMSRGFLGFWGIEPDTGRDLAWGEVRFEVSDKTDWKKIEQWLREKKRDYLIDKEYMRKDWKARQVVNRKDEAYYKVMNGARKVLKIHADSARDSF